MSLYGKAGKIIRKFKFLIFIPLINPPAAHIPYKIKNKRIRKLGPSQNHEYGPCSHYYFITFSPKAD